MRLRPIAAVAIVSLAALGVDGSRPAPVAAAEYELVTTAAYDVRPEVRQIDVAVAIAFTNTTPDPAGQFSVFDEIKLAIHDEASGVTGTDADGDLDVGVAVENEVNVATISLRDRLRFNDTVEVQLRYALADSNDPQLRIRPSVIVFPAWGFGTTGEVSVAVPSGYEVRVDGDPLNEADDRFVSGQIDDPSRWLALVTATHEPEYASFAATVPLEGGTADLRVRAFADDEAWGERTLDLVERALPLLEEEIGLPYPQVGELLVTESVASDATGFGESGATGTEILIAFDESPFTAVHQLAHVWLSSTLIEARWIREGLASEVAARVAPRLDVEFPFDPAAEAVAGAADAFPLDSWSTVSPDAKAEAYAHPASWALLAELTAEAGPDAVRGALARVAASMDAYSSAEVEVQGSADSIGAPRAALTSRSFLDHLEALSGTDLAGHFADTVFDDADAALLAARAEARAALGELVAAAGGWGTPDPIRADMTSWSFEDARGQIDEAISWLTARSAMLTDMEAVGLSAPDRLRQAFVAYGGGVEAQRELEAERAAVDAYTRTADAVNGERTFLQRVGLIGGPEPTQQLTVAHGLFVEGDLPGAVDATTEAQRILDSAGVDGAARVASVVIVAILLTVAALVFFRRRASYTAAA